VREVGGLLEGYRLVTVTGPGGVGKARLAAAVADRVADGPWLAGLSPVLIRDAAGRGWARQAERHTAMPRPYLRTPDRTRRARPAQR
jgi:hypothetical protein